MMGEVCVCLTYILTCFIYNSSKHHAMGIWRRRFMLRYVVIGTNEHVRSRSICKRDAIKHHLLVCMLCDVCLNRSAMITHFERVWIGLSV